MAAGKHTFWHHRLDLFTINQVELIKRAKKTKNKKPRTMKPKKVFNINAVELLDPIPMLKFLRLPSKNGPIFSHFGFRRT